MQPLGPWRRSGIIELAAATALFAILTVIFTYPLAFHLGSLGYRVQQPGDGQYSVWNVAWVAHALLTHPLDVLNANIFHPHEGTLVYSEANLVAGALAVPVYWWTNNPFAALNFVLLISFVLSGLATYYLVRYLAQDRRAAVIAAICFAYCPYVFGHLPHIQLLMTAGIPLSLLMFHRVSDEPSLWRGAALGLVMGLQALACGYYGIFVVLFVGLGVLITMVGRRRWRDWKYWRALVVGAVVALTMVAPLLRTYLILQRATGFARTLADAQEFAATWRSYLTSAAYASRWLHQTLPGWQPESDVLFPGYMPLTLGLVGIVAGWRLGMRIRHIAVTYTAAAAIALWLSLGPDFGLYSASYATLHSFSFLRAPSRFGVVVTLALSVLAGITCARVLARTKRSFLVASILIAAAIGLRLVPIEWGPVPAFPDAYYALAREPRGPLVELPLYSRRANVQRTNYMLASTVHWMPLVNAYSDIIPQQFTEERDVLGEFPSRDAFEILKRDQVRYASFHLSEYVGKSFDDLVAKLDEFSPYLERLHGDRDIWLYRIVGYPPSDLDARR